MTEEDSREAPHLYESNVLRNMKYEQEKKKHLDSNPLSALSKLKRLLQRDGNDVVHDVGLDLIYVHLWSTHQKRLYNAFRKTEDSWICIDATGGIATKVQHIDQTMSHSIFFYAIVLICPAGKFTVAGMFSERQTTVEICSFL